MTAAPTGLLTIEEYERRPGNDRREELVRGRVVELTSPTPRHGYICANIAAEIHRFVREHALGRVFTNDSGVVTRRDPDTLRGADVAFLSYERLPQGPLPRGYLHVAPDVIFEVLSPEDRRAHILEKVAEYLDAGVSTVCIVDPDHRSVTVHQAGVSERLVTGHAPLRLDELPGFSLPIARFFE